MNEASVSTAAALARENEELRLQLLEAEELITAIRTGAVDALAVQGADGPRIFTLEGADQSYRTLIEQMNEGALLLGEDATVLYCNACMAELLDRALEEMIGGTFDRFVPAEFRTYWTTLCESGWAVGKAKGELPLMTYAGVLVPFALSMNVLTFNSASVLAVIVTDLSAQRKINTIQAQVAEQNAVIDRKNEELKRQEAARLVSEQAAAEANRMLEGIPHIAWTASPEGVNTSLNRRWFSFIGRESAETNDIRWLEHLHPDDHGPADVRWRTCLRTGATFEMEYRFRNKDGDYRWMLGRALPSYDEQGHIIEWIGTCTDIHEHKLALERIDQAQRQLQDNNEQLRRANVDLDNFIYTASHDLKAPISNIEGLLHALLWELPKEKRSGEVEPIMNMIQDSVDRFKRTIEHLTEVSKLQKEHAQPTAWMRLADVIQEVTLDLAPLVQASGAQLIVDVEACPAIAFSEKNLRSVIYNLLSNALKYRAPGRVPEVRLFCQTKADYVVLEVHDNGLGLTPSNQLKLFSMFQRFHSHVDGSGIGLYMVKKMVENAGGKIEVSSQLDIGSTFSVYFRR
ncbi:ATP-binding protein [Hymenobacter sp. BT491]|uniref:ATP-binding protein n=1 Tax=Hymenobacter sp. BT491 TaxID=2766779 RepID=UPI00165383DD|nr:ATP-binding protein [Hymenobacter sp. BT491]MBC6991079.1 PAS domain-containing protein [Hymenobacter sp. BT491]